MADAPKPLGPFTLVTVNTAPERAKRLIGRFVEHVKDQYTIIYAANAESTSPPPLIYTIGLPFSRVINAAANGGLAIDEVKDLVEKIQPDVLVSPSGITAAESG